MKAVLIGEPAGASREAVMAVFPRHKLVVDKFIARGVAASARSRAGQHGGVIQEWRDALLPE